jgi:hypothetical protein
VELLFLPIEGFLITYIYSKKYIELDFFCEKRGTLVEV